MKESELRQAVREGYARMVKQRGSCCAPQSSCCGGANPAETISRNIGYSETEMAAVPEGANLGLGCGNPVALASLQEGETVIDLGSGAGFDCFLAADRVGSTGRVIGVDMTPEMIERARENARQGDYANVEFRLGEIENLPAADGSADAVISNCVINLSPDKGKVFSEAWRVLRPGGRLMVSDIVLLQELPDHIRNSIEAYVGCLSGAVMKDRYLETIAEAGFGGVEVIEEQRFPIDCLANDPTARAIIDKSDVSMKEAEDVAGSVISIKVQGIKPA